MDVFVRLIVVTFLLAGFSFADGLNFGASAFGSLYNMVGLDVDPGKKVFPSEGGYGGQVSVDAMFPFWQDLSLRTGVAAEYRDFRGAQSRMVEGGCPFGEPCEEKMVSNDIAVSLLYLEIPVLVRTHASPTVVIEGGPIVGFNLLSKYYGPKDSEKSEWSDIKETELVELGFTANLVLQMTDNLELALRAAYMIFDVLDEDELDYKITSQTIKFHLGFTYWFGGGLEAKKSEEKKTSP